MTDISYDEFIPHVLPEIPGCPDFTILRTAPEAVRSFCERTHIWRVWAPLYTAAGVGDYPIAGFLEIGPHEATITANKGDGKGEISAAEGIPYADIAEGDVVTIRGTSDNNCTRVVESVGDSGEGRGSLVTFTSTLSGTDGTLTGVMILPSLRFAGDVARILKVLDENDEELTLLSDPAPLREKDPPFKRPRAYGFEAPKTIIIRGAPVEEKVFFIRAALKPAYDADGTGVMPDWIFNEYHDVIANNIKSRILFMKSAKWYDPKQAVNYLAAYQSAVSGIRGLETRGFDRSKKRKINHHL